MSLIAKPLDFTGFNLTWSYYNSNTLFPFCVGLSGNTDHFRNLFLRHSFHISQQYQIFSKHVFHLLCVILLYFSFRTISTIQTCHIILFYVKFGCIIKRNSQSTKFPICRIRLQINQFSIQPVFLHKGIVLTCFCHNTFIQHNTYLIFIPLLLERIPFASTKCVCVLLTNFKKRGCKKTPLTEKSPRP